MRRRSIVPIGVTRTMASWRNAGCTAAKAVKVSMKTGARRVRVLAAGRSGPAEEERKKAKRP